MFTSTFYPEPAKTRCYKCGSDNIAAICHHCGRAMDESHSGEKQAHLNEGAANEFSGLELSGNTAFEGVAEHCELCMHEGKRGWGLFFIGLLLLIVGGCGLYYAKMISGVSPVWSKVVFPGGLVLGTVLTLSGIMRLARTWTSYDTNRLSLPVVAEKIQVEIREVIKGTISLTDQRTYTSTLQKIRGECEVNYFCNALQESSRYARYKDNRNVARDEDIHAHFGFIQLSGAAEVSPEGKNTFLAESANVLQVDTPVSNLLFLRESNVSRKDSTFVFRQNYTIPASRAETSAVPIIILPVILGEETHRTLQLQIYFQLSGWITDVVLEVDRVEVFDINVPNELGRVVSTQPTGLIEPRKENKATGVLWKNPTLAKRKIALRQKESEVGQTQVVDCEPLALNISLDNDIIAKGDTMLKGQLRLRLKGLCSGIREARFFSALGKQLPDNQDVSMGTFVDITFELSLAALLTQKVHIIKKEIVEPNISPDYFTVGSIIKELNENEIVVGNVHESAPHTGRGGSNILYRRWDLGGHYFEGLWPMKFNLTITGQQSDKQPGMGSAGNTMVEVTVRSNYHEDGMQDIIVNFSENLVDLVKAAIENIPRNVNGEEHVRMNNTPDEKLEQLEDALLSGRISEDIYREIRERILA